MCYDEIVATATVGVNQRPLTLTSLAGPAAVHAAVLDTGDPAAAVLGAAALLTAARRAGVLTATVAAIPAVAAADSAPELSPAASSVITFALSDGDHALLAELLTAAAAAGFRAAAPELPAILDAAVRDRSLRPAAAAVLGERGRWLAAHRADWQRVASAASLAVSDDPAAWETGGRGERRAWLAALRRRDPDTARDLLAAGWSREAGDVREELIGVLTIALSDADEPFLEAALDDRKSSVRQAAAALLSAIPSSAFNARAASRAAGLLHIERRGLRRSLAVSLPASCDPAAARDGIITAPPSARIGAGAWLLTQFIAAVPLREWTTRFGLDAASLAEMPVQGGFRADVHAGWRLAAVRQQDASWAVALLAVGDDSSRGRPPMAWPEPAKLAAVLPADMRAAQAAALLTAQGASRAAAAAVADCPGPWPDRLADAVLGHLARVARAASQPRRPDSILWAAASKLPAGGRRDFAAELRRLAAAGQGGGYLVAELIRAADSIDRRRLFLEELH